jgi:predicted esterase
MPLVVGADPHEHEDLTDAQQRARKVKPQYARGAVAKVAMGRNQAEAEMIQGILLEEGIPSVLQRMRGFDVPDFLAAGPRDIMVPQSGVQAARTLLEQLEPRDEGEQAEEWHSTTPTPYRFLAAILAVLVAILGLSLLLLQISS